MGRGSRFGGESAHLETAVGGEVHGLECEVEVADHGMVDESEAGAVFAEVDKRRNGRRTPAASICTIRLRFELRGRPYPNSEDQAPRASRSNSVNRAVSRK